ncbi:UDP-glucuronosyltransferase 2A3-like [Cherax quadricarinatus]|uniref:UDP-glucuronosyltransferase 2A3-like n=1 Tax=Cherax quadricarinatus TaxID=27406 RepID=UPI0023798726|nr:UDP-glucuronosyltransferase 2A3-like [Cherax quadricarinatus]
MLQVTIKESWWLVFVMVSVGAVMTEQAGTAGDYGGMRVLVLHPIAAGSHVLTLRALCQALVAKGHQVTVVRWQEARQLPVVDHPSITEIVLTINNTDGSVPYMTLEETASFVMPQEIMWSHGTSWKVIPLDAFITVSAYCKALLGDLPLRHHLRLQRFHVAVVDIIYNECGLALAHDLGVPSVGYWAFTLAGGEAQYTTAFSPPSAVPILFTHYTDVMTFNQRLVNHLYALGSHVVMQVQQAVTWWQIKKYLPSSPPPGTLLAELSGMLINSHPALDYPRLLPPSFINVGGLQIQPTKPLPKDLEEWVGGSGSAGTILFTMGFLFNSRVFPAHVISNLMGAFARLPQRVLMKLEEEFPAPPANVKVVTWLPQQDVLGHNKTVLFYTHCGMHGVLEALYHAVPMVGMPVFLDQRDVLVRMEERGVARGVSKEPSEEEIYQAIVQVLNDPSYRENAGRMSQVIRDHPVEPMDEALWLVEHVANTRGAPHLKFSARHLNFCQFFGLDVFAFMLMVPFCLFYGLPHIVKYILSNFMVLGSHRSKLKVS